MMGLPPNQGTKVLNIPTDALASDAKTLLRTSFRIHDALVIQLIYKGQPLSDAENITKKLDGMDYSLEKDTITVITQQAGG